MNTKSSPTAGYHIVNMPETQALIMQMNQQQLEKSEKRQKNIHKFFWLQK